MKVCDTLTTTPGPLLNYVDSDVMAFRPFTGLFCLPDPATRMLLMRDVQEAVSVKWHHALLGRGVPLPARANAGILCHEVAAFDWDFAEWFAGQKHLMKMVYWSEQTFWAALGQRIGVRYWDPSQVLMVSAGQLPDAQTVLGHFAGDGRRFLDQYSKAPADAGLKAPERIGTIVPEPCTAGKLFRTYLKNKFRAG